MKPAWGPNASVSDLSIARRNCGDGWTFKRIISGHSHLCVLVTLVKDIFLIKRK